MAQRGITRDAVLAKAIEMIERSGSPTVSMRELAEELGIRTPSLYNHVKCVNELLVEVSRYAAEELRQAQLAAIDGKTGDAALFGLAAAYRRFAQEHKGLYKLTLSLPTLPEASQPQLAAAIAEPILFVLSRYGLDEEQVMHWQRVLRAIIHGFLSQEEAGFFRHSPVSAEVSYQVAVRCFVCGLHAEQEENSHAGE